MHLAIFTTALNMDNTLGCCAQ